MVTSVRYFPSWLFTARSYKLCIVHQLMNHYAVVDRAINIKFVCRLRKRQKLCQRRWDTMFLVMSVRLFL
jgi:hypothetical protein